MSLNENRVVKSQEKAPKSTEFKPKCDNVYLKMFPTPHVLSMEEQAYFIKITEAVFGYNESMRNENLKTVASDYNIKFLAPYLVQFIKETIHLNLVLTDLTLLIYAIRLAKSLLANVHVNLKELIHDLLPAVLSCALAKKISKYYYDNHWTLRDFSSYVVATICHLYANKTNLVLERVIGVYLQPVRDPYSPLTTLYGALRGLTSLGEETTKSYIMPHASFIGKRLYVILENRNFMQDRQQNLEAKHIRDLLVNTMSPILYKTKNINDGGILYTHEFGYFGYLIYLQVKNLERLDIGKKITLQQGPPFGYRHSW